MYSLDTLRGGWRGFKANYRVFDPGKFYPGENGIEASGPLGMMGASVVLKVPRMRSKKYCHIPILHSPPHKGR